MLASVDIDPKELRSRLLEAGIPNLWIPRIIFKVESIPHLATGKLDLQGMNALVGQRMQEEG